MKQIETTSVPESVGIEVWIQAVSKNEVTSDESMFSTMAAMALATILMGDVKTGTVAVSNKALAFIANTIHLNLSAQHMSLSDLRFQFQNGYTSWLFEMAAAAPDDIVDDIRNMIDDDDEFETVGNA